MIVDKNWFMFDTCTVSLVLQRFGCFGDNILVRTTNSSEIWRNIFHSDKMMDGEILMVLLEWTIHGNPACARMCVCSLLILFYWCMYGACACVYVQCVDLLL